MQLLEFRHIDNRLDDVLSTAYGTIHALTRSWLPFWRSQGRSLRILGEFKAEANGFLSARKMYSSSSAISTLARVHRLLASRFHLDRWEQSIQRKLEVAEGVYRVVSDQTDTHRAAFLEIVVVLLIVLEILLAILHR